MELYDIAYGFTLLKVCRGFRENQSRSESSHLVCFSIMFRWLKCSCQSGRTDSRHTNNNKYYLP